jgi:hypothetical protein
MKILHVSYSKEFAGYGDAARTDLRALHASGVNLTARAYELKPSIEDPLVKELEERPLDGVTHVIQYLVPSHWERFPGVKNIGYFEVESDDLSYSIWPECMHFVDEIWVPNHDARKTVSKVTNLPVYVVPHAVDQSVYSNQYPPITVTQSLSDYFFYTIAENVPRKNLASLIACFFIEFDPTEPVSLMIKTSSNLDNMITNIQKRIKLYKNLENYQQLAVIDQKIEDNQIFGIHQSCHCYINPSMGESWCMPLVDAIGFNNSIITIDVGGPRDIVQNIRSDEKLFKLDSIKTWCEGHTNFPGLQNGRDTWRMFDTDQMRKSMRSAYNNRNSQETISHTLNRYCFENFVARVKELCN